ncbi:MAG: protoporphyrinogen oxidase, partial [Polyangiaceae bacterium]|nr:protoporphyrinogen oxidase [Polyangiaceae bacterium]
MKEKRVAIVGGGVSGLVIGNKLAKAPDRFSFRVFENRARFGGNIHTAAVETAHGSLVVEDGPDSWVAAKPETEVLARALKLDASIIEPKQRGVYLLQGDQFARMPDGLVLGIPTEIRAFLRSPTLSWGAKGRALMEPFVSKQKLYPFEDESVASFLRRRLGAAYTEELVAPLLGGVFAGNPEELSMRASFPQLLAAESTSLVKTFRTARKARIAKDGRPPATFFSFKRGMQELIDALVAALPQT